jgi:hypothetical protein
MEFKETKIIKTFFVLEKKEFGFSPKDGTKNQILFSNRRLMPTHSKKPKPADHHRNPSPIAVLTSLSRERERKKKTKTQPFNQLPIKPPNHGIYSRQQRNDPASRSRKKKKNTKSENSGRLKRSRQPTQPSRPTLLVTPPEPEGPRKQK